MNFYQIQGATQKGIDRSFDYKYLDYEDEVVDLIASRCTDVESGARMVDSILTNTLLPEIGQELLTRLMEGKTAKRVHIGVKDSEFTYSFD